MTDTPARLVTEPDVPAGAWRFVGMPPGWHITTGPGAVLYHPDYLGRGTFTLDAEVFLFPAPARTSTACSSADDPSTRRRPQSWTAFVARRDGSGAVLKRTPAGVTPLVAWKQNVGVVAHTGSGTAKQILRIDVGPVDIAYTANGTEVAKIPRADVRTDGPFGFRAGKDLNLHVSRLDVTFRLAPQRPPGRP